jgi:hypothetical protein
MMMRTPLILAAAIIGFSASAFAQTAVPKGAAKPLKQPPAPMGCKLVGTVKGTKLWAGDCVPAELAPPPAAAEPEPELKDGIRGGKQ